MTLPKLLTTEQAADFLSMDKADFLKLANKSRDLKPRALAAGVFVWSSEALAKIKKKRAFIK